MARQRKRIHTTTKAANQNGQFKTIIGFCKPDDNTVYYVDGLLDTGANRTVVSQNVAELLDLDPVLEVPCSTAGGIVWCKEYEVDVFFKGEPDVIIPNFRILSNPVTADNYCLIGTDIICKGDFSVSCLNKDAVLSFRFPGQVRVDYTRWEKLGARKKNNSLCTCGTGKRYKNCCGKNNRY